MRDRVGKFLDQGIGIGFTDELLAVGNDMEKSLDEAIPKPEDFNFNSPEIAYKPPEIPDFDDVKIAFESVEFPKFDDIKIPDFEVPEVEFENPEIEIIMPDIEALKLILDIEKMPVISAKSAENELQKFNYDADILGSLNAHKNTMNSVFYQPSPSVSYTASTSNPISLIFLRFIFGAVQNIII